MGTVAADDPRRRMAAALRPIVTMTVASTFDDGVLDRAADQLEELGRTLSAVAGPKRARQQPNISQHAQEFFPTSPIMGMANPLAPPVVVHVVDGMDGGYPEIRAEAWFDWAYEGPPTCVHGGVIAETFDEMLGAANMVAGNPGMTGTLTVRYRKPTPLRTPLRIEAPGLRRDGRKISTWAGIYHGDLLTAEADGLFIEVQPAQFLAIAEGNVDNADPSVLEAMRAEAVRVGAASDVQLSDPASGPPGSPTG
jgi:acyl-coenzyme A thioesterase PaaI-like protein